LIKSAELSLVCTAARIACSATARTRAAGLVLHAQVLAHELPVPLGGAIRIDLGDDLLRQLQHTTHVADDCGWDVGEPREYPSRW
jgi:hypothetical protein